MMLPWAPLAPVRHSCSSSNRDWVLCTKPETFGLGENAKTEKKMRFFLGEDNWKRHNQLELDWTNCVCVALCAVVFMRQSYFENVDEWRNCCGRLVITELLHSTSSKFSNSRLNKGGFVYSNGGSVSNSTAAGLKLDWKKALETNEFKTSKPPPTPLVSYSILPKRPCGSTCATTSGWLCCRRLNETYSLTSDNSVCLFSSNIMTSDGKVNHSQLFFLFKIVTQHIRKSTQIVPLLSSHSWKMK